MSAAAPGSRQGGGRGKGPDPELEKLGSSPNSLGDLEETPCLRQPLCRVGACPKAARGLRDPGLWLGSQGPPWRGSQPSRGTQQQGALDHSDSGSPFSTAPEGDGLDRRLEMSQTEVTLGMATVNSQGQRQQSRLPQTLPSSAQAISMRQLRAEISWQDPQVVPAAPPPAPRPPMKAPRTALWLINLQIQPGLGT